MCKQAQRKWREETDVEIAGATRRQGWCKSNKGMRGEETKMTSGFQNWVEVIDLASDVEFLEPPEQMG